MCLLSAPAADWQEQALEVTERAQDYRQRIRVESALRQRQDLQAVRIQSCSLLAVT
jgi:hypothetical protein